MRSPFRRRASSSRRMRCRPKRLRCSRTTTSTSSSTKTVSSSPGERRRTISPDTETHLYIISSADGGETWEFERDIFLGADMREPRFVAIGGYLQLMFFEAGTNPGAFEPMRLWRTRRLGPSAVVGSRGPHRRRRDALGRQGPRRGRLSNLVHGRALRRRRHVGDRRVLQAVRPTVRRGPTSAAATTSTSAACRRWRSSSTSTARCGR